MRGARVRKVNASALVGEERISGENGPGVFFDFVTVTLG
jgi:hypothetical protein